MSKCFAQANAIVGANCIRGQLVPYWFYNTMYVYNIANNCNAMINHLQHIFAKHMKLNFLLPLLIFGGGRPILGAYTLMTCPVLPKLLENAEGAAAHQSTFLHLP